MKPPTGSKSIPLVPGAKNSETRDHFSRGSKVCSLLVLVAPERGESLLLYIAARNHVVSAALIIEREEPGHPLKVQQSVYFVGEVLADAKVRYP